VTGNDSIRADQPLTSRERFLRWCITAALAVPIGAGVAATVAVAVDAARASRPADEGDWRLAMSAAVERGDLGAAHAVLVLRGNANDFIPVRHRELTRDQVVWVTPLVYAAARGDAILMRMLLDNGADPRQDRNRLAVCAAQNQPAAREVLDAWQVTSAIECPLPQRRRPVLLQLAEAQGTPPP
jgi:hypothetical protein